MSDYRLGIENDKLRVLLNDYENELSRTKREAREKIQDLEAKLAKAVEHVRKLRELAIDLWENDASETDWLDVEYYHDLIDKTETFEQIKKRD